MSEEKKRLTPEEMTALETEIMLALKTVYDPEIPVDIYALGMIYEIEVDPEGVGHVVMTLTAPNCPVADSIVLEVEERIKMIPGISGADVVLTFDPPWNKDMMSEEAKLELGYL